MTIMNDDYISLCVAILETLMVICSIKCSPFMKDTMYDNRNGHTFSSDLCTFWIKRLKLKRLLKVKLKYCGFSFMQQLQNFTLP